MPAGVYKLCAAMMPTRKKGKRKMNGKELSQYRKLVELVIRQGADGKTVVEQLKLLRKMYFATMKGGQE